MRTAGTPLPHEEPAGFFFALNLLVGIVALMAIVSIGMMLYGGLQFLGY